MFRFFKKKKQVPQHIFKMYDIRGLADEELSSDVMHKIGQSYGTVCLNNDVHQLVVASDARLSSPQLKDALIEGILSTGCNVIDVGTVPTPVMYFATHCLGTNTGLMVTASHNPPEYNGVKMVLLGQSLYGENIQKLYNRICKGNFRYGRGRLKKNSVVADYYDAICSDIRLKSPLKVVVDCANGIAGSFAPHILRQIGCEVIELYCEVDGTFPNHEADPTVLKNLADLIEMVRDEEADVGLALDGDGDRLVAVSPYGEVIWPDRLMILFAKEILSRHPGRKVVFDVKCTRALPSEIEKAGGEPIMWMTGHSLMKAKLRECDGIFGGEMSGHLFFHDRWPGFDDGIYAAARLCELLVNSDQSVYEIFNNLPSFVSTPEMRIKCNRPHQLIEKFKHHVKFCDARISFLDGIRADYEDGFALVRASNTAQEIVMRFEADSKESLDRIQNAWDEEMKEIEGLKSDDLG